MAVTEVKPLEKKSLVSDGATSECLQVDLAAWQDHGTLPGIGRPSPTECLAELDGPVAPVLHALVGDDVDAMRRQDREVPIAEPNQMREGLQDARWGMDMVVPISARGWLLLLLQSFLDGILLSPSWQLGPGLGLRRALLDDCPDRLMVLRQQVILQVAPRLPRDDVLHQLLCQSGRLLARDASVREHGQLDADDPSPM